MACEYGWRAAPPTLDGSRRSSSCRGSPSSYLAPFNQLIRSVFRDARATHLESLVVHLQREQTELKGSLREQTLMIQSLCRHHGVAEVVSFPSVPTEDALAA